MSEERFNRIEDMLGTLIQMMGNSNARLEELTERVDGLTEGVDGLTKRVDGLTERVDHLTERVDRLDGKLDKVSNDLIDFREEVNGRFDRVESKLRIMEVDADLMHRKLSDQERELNRHNALLKKQ